MASLNVLCILCRGRQNYGVNRRRYTGSDGVFPVVEDYRSQLEKAGLELVIVNVGERLSEEELLPPAPAIHGAICGDHQFTERVLHAAPQLKVISKWGTGIDSIDTNAAARPG